MSNDVVVVSKRESFGKADNRELRKGGLMPAVVYGLNEPPMAIAISPKIVARILSSESGSNSLVLMQREGTDVQRHVIIKDIQRNPVTGRLTHVDFMRVDPTHKVRVKVPVRLIGVAFGVKAQGGMLDFIHRELEIECLPSLIPAHVDVNVEALKVGDSLRFDQLPIASTLRIVGDAHETICSLRAKTVEEVAAEPVAVAVAEPEVVANKGKKEKEKK